MADIKERAKRIMTEQLMVDRSELTSNASFIDDLGADSLDTVELIMEFEDEFGFKIPDEEAEKIETVGDAIKYLKEKVEKEKSPT